MDLFYFKIVLLVNGWLFAVGSPVAMLQHATSSQSIVFHQDLSPSAPTVNTPSPVFKSSDSQPGYEYKYEVSDQHTGDKKSHWESREGDRVRGSYTLYEPDGAVRTVEYTVDAAHGFNAVVTRNIPTKHQYPAQTINANQVSNHNSESSRNGGYTSNKNTFSSQRYDEATGYPVSSRQRSGDVGFSVIHEARNSERDASQLY